jgi:hypothetical protein
MDDPVLRVQSQLTDRDRILLGWFYDHGVLTTPQLANALFPSLDFCQRRLRTLYRLRLIARFRPPRADGGPYPYHWVIDQLCAEVVAAARDERPPRRDHARLERRRWTSTRTLAHRLGVNQFFTDLAGHARTHPGAQLRQWLPEAACQRSGAFTLPDDPALVRAYQPRVRPDGYGLWVDAGRQVPFFLEYDTGPNNSASWPARSSATTSCSSRSTGRGRCCSGCTPPPANATCGPGSPTCPPSYRSPPAPGTTSRPRHCPRPSPCGRVSQVGDCASQDLVAPGCRLRTPTSG